MTKPTPHDVALYATAVLIKCHVDDTPTYVNDWALDYIAEYEAMYSANVRDVALVALVQSKPMPACTLKPRLDFVNNRGE